MKLLPLSPRAAKEIDPRLDAALRYGIAIGAMVVMLLPAARGMQATIGWLPLWLLAMPMAGWWALHGFPVPRATPAPRVELATRGARHAPQARRRARPSRQVALPRVA